MTGIFCDKAINGKRKFEALINWNTVNYIEKIDEETSRIWFNNMRCLNLKESLSDIISTIKGENKC